MLAVLIQEDREYHEILCTEYETVPWQVWHRVSDLGNLQIGDVLGEHELSCCLTKGNWS